MGRGVVTALSRSGWFPDLTILKVYPNLDDSHPLPYRLDLHVPVSADWSHFFLSSSSLEEWLHYFLEDTFVPISTSAHHAVTSLSRRMQAWIWRVVSTGYFTVICAKEAKLPRKAGPKSWDMLLVKILLLEDLLLHNKHLRSSICNKQGRRKGKYLSYANSHSTWSHCEGFRRNKVRCHGEMELVPIIARKPNIPIQKREKLKRLEFF